MFVRWINFPLYFSEEAPPLPETAEPKAEENSPANSSALNAEVLLFGEDLQEQPIEGAIELSSDENSASGDEYGPIGNDFVSLWLRPETVPSIV